MGSTYSSTACMKDIFRCSMRFFTACGVIEAGIDQEFSGL